MIINLTLGIIGGIVIGLATPTFPSFLMAMLGALLLMLSTQYD